MKNILILATLDEKGEGHARSFIKLFESLRYNVSFVPMIRRDSSVKTFIMDALSVSDFRYFYFRLSSYFRKLLFFPFKEARSSYQGESYVTSDLILSKIDFTPDYICIGSHIRFLTPRIISELYFKTGAAIILLMVDEQILGGGCYYPLDCNQYVTGCTNCPRFPYGKCIPKNIYKSKVKYLSSIPFHIVGSPFDLDRASKVSFLKEKIMHPFVGVPTIPFKISKSDARKKFNIDNHDFVILAGAVSLKDRRKGFKELEESLLEFAKQVSANRSVTLLLLGKNTESFHIEENIKICAPGYLKLEEMFTAFYACDIFVSSSLEDSGPYMVNYSIACGRPVVAFPVGIAMTLVRHKQTGYIASYKDTSDFAIGINYFYNMEASMLLRAEELCEKHLSSFRDKKWYDFLDN